MLNQPTLSDYSADERLELILAKLPPVTFPKTLQPIKMRRRTQREFDGMRSHFREALWAAQNGKCARCEKPFTRNSNATFDHVQPLSRGGYNWIGNLLLMHPCCNVAKGDNPPGRALREMLDDVNIRLQTNPASAPWFR